MVLPFKRGAVGEIVGNLPRFFEMVDKVNEGASDRGRVDQRRVFSPASAAAAIRELWVRLPKGGADLFLRGVGHV